MFDIVADPKMVNKTRAVNISIKARENGPHTAPPRIPKPHKERTGVVVGFFGHFGFVQPKVPNHCGRSYFFHVNDMLKMMKSTNDDGDDKNCGSIKVGSKVVFDLKSDGNGKIRCINLRKVFV